MIRQRLKQQMPKPVKKTGYPAPLFRGYKRHFGVTVAVIQNAKMQALAGYADRKVLSGLGEAPAFIFYSNAALGREVMRRMDDKIPLGGLEQALLDWPESDTIPTGLLFDITLL